MKHVIFFVFSFFLTHALAGLDEWENLVQKVQQDALDLAKQVESLYQNRCNLDSLLACNKGNYEGCLSSYPNRTCPGGENITFSACSDGTLCSWVYDYTVSNVRFGPDIDPTEPKDNLQAIEAICFTRTLDEWIINKRNSDKQFWDNLGVPPPDVYFGSHTGAFRIFPARQSITCESYDPRVRPWYIAGSSGPKNVVLVLDTSGSLVTNDKNRFPNMKAAAIQIVETLTMFDRVAIVTFATNASLIADDNGAMFEANTENKEFLIQQINNTEAIGGTNFQDAFERAFGVLDRTAELELTTDCNTAILFLTDGDMTDSDGATPDDILAYVDERIDDFEALTNRPVFLFTYSVASQDEDVNVHAFPRALACSTEYGVWSKIESASEIFDSLTGYYRFFALGLGNNKNVNFTAWVEPYLFKSGPNLVGTTVSAPVYDDRSKSTPLFLGVVGIDLLVNVVEAVLGNYASEASSRLEELSGSSSATCPSINITQCQLESFRRQFNDDANANCSSNCSASDYVGVEEQSCATASYYPSNLLINTDNENFKACCKVGESVPSDTCPSNVADPLTSTMEPTPNPMSSNSLDKSEPAKNSIPPGAIAGLVLGCLALVVALAGGFILWRRSK